MRTFFKKYKVLFTLLICLFSSYNINAQESKQDTLSQVKSYQKTAAEAILIQDFESAIINLNKARKLIEPFKDNSLKASIHLSIAELQYNLHNYNKAVSETIQSFTYLKKTEDKLLTGKAYYLYGSILTKTHHFNEAELNLKDADQLFTELNNEKYLGLNVLAFGILELEREHPVVAINYFKRRNSAIDQISINLL